MTQREIPRRGRTHGEYVIREADRADANGFLELRSSVFESWPSGLAPDIFEWKYDDVPYVDELPVLVALDGDEIVGARGYFALEMSVGGERFLGLQSDDLMVHPDHRRQGLFREMNAFGLERYGSASPSPFLFTFGGKGARRGYEKQGWEIVENSPSVRPRLGDGGAYAPADASRAELAKAIGFPLYGLALGVQDRIAPPAVDRVTAHDEPPLAELVTLYERHVPDRVHAVRTAEFYEWRLRDPRSTYTTYLAWNGDRVEAGVIASRRPGDDVVRVREVLPFRGSDGAVRAALVRALADGDDARTAAAWIPRSRRREFLRSGFVPTGPIPWAPTGSDRIITRPIDGVWERNGVAFDDPDAWALQLLARAH